MIRSFFLALLFLLLLCETYANSCQPKATTINYNAVSHDMKLLCYYGSWAVYRPGDGKFPVENIDPFLCTHLIYAFAGLGWDNRIKSLDPYYDLEENYGKGAFKRFNNLKKKNLNLKTIVAIGGWNEGSIKYSNMAAQAASRKVFVESCVEFISKYGFDGLDMDWEYPAARGGKPEDKRNFALLLSELKEAFLPHGYLLTSAVSAGKWFMDPAYDIPRISKSLDIINVMCYDYHGGWENKTGHNAPLFARPSEVENQRLMNVNFSINYWISKGAQRNKIVMGMGTYGRSFTLQRAENNELDAPAPQKGQAGPYTREPGSLGYNEICESRMKHKWTEVRDPYVLAPYAYKDRLWVGYDDNESITLKAQYIKAMGLAGGMIWSIETDDFLGKCHGEKYPLLKAINKVFESSSALMPTPGSTEAPPHTVVSSAMPSTERTWWPRPPSSTTRWWPPTSTPSTTSTTSTSQPTSTTKEQTPAEQTTSRTRTTKKWPWAPTHPESTTSKTVKPWTTTRRTSTTQGKLICKETGMHRHPEDCKKFYQCVGTREEGKYRIYEYTCPDETVFDMRTKRCTWPKEVSECNNVFFKKRYNNRRSQWPRRLSLSESEKDMK